MSGENSFSHRQIVLKVSVANILYILVKKKKINSASINQR